MARLFGFDYRSPFCYRVTLKRLDGLLPLSQIGPDGVVENDVTAAFRAVISSFHATWRCIDAISTFVVMPDHVHLLIRIRDVQPRKSLPVLVWQLARTLSRVYWEVASAHAASGKCAAAGGGAGSVFSPDWHDWIVKKRGQLDAFRRYVLENPARAWLRRVNAQYFGRVSEVSFLDRRWFAYGNSALLGLPVVRPFRCSRSLVRDSPEWNAFTAAAERICPGGAGVGTFMSPCEKECGNRIAKAGGSWIVLSPDGFGPRWHPPRAKERFCAAGRMLFLSLYPHDSRKPDPATLYRRCHAMGDIVAAMRQ